VVDLAFYVQALEALVFGVELHLPVVGLVISTIHFVNLLINFCFRVNKIEHYNCRCMKKNVERFCWEKIIIISYCHH
jgi:hypothetical protein